jgi:sterol desaturase/sphingolipid hydroxylase (fatty acid hydroxylase superfamily)
MMDALIDTFATVQSWLFQNAILPIVYATGFGGFAEEAFLGTEWLVLGIMQIAIMACVIQPLERRFPVEALTDRAAVRTDMLYTFIHRLGLFRLAMFFVLVPLFDWIEGHARLAGWQRTNLENWLPGGMSSPVLAFFAYLVLFDLLDYVYHRLSHRLRWWWALHAVHHSQRQMTVWSDNRNHLLDDMLRDAVFAVVALAVGVEPAQFILLVAISQLFQSLQHANLRLGFGRVGERLLVSPRFHRLHHGVGIGHESGGRLGGCNFGVLFPWWDILFRTANFSPVYLPTGIRDQVSGQRDYGRTFVAQQWKGLGRLLARS